MKLIQYRFSTNDAKISSRIGSIVESFFSSVTDGNFMAFYIDGEFRDRIVRKYIRSDDIQSISSESFYQSYLETLSYGKVWALKAVSSCHFIVFEDDGLLRICCSNDDRPPDFGETNPVISDASELLITTDLFDHL